MTDQRHIRDVQRAYREGAPASPIATGGRCIRDAHLNQPTPAFDCQPTEIPMMGIPTRLRCLELAAPLSSTATQALQTAAEFEAFLSRPARPAVVNSPPSSASSS